MVASVRAAERWGLVAAGTALVGTCYGFARFAYGLFAPQFQAEFAVGPTLSGLIGAGSYVGYCVAIVVSLVLTRRLGARRVAVAAGAVATLGTAMVALAPSAPILAAGVLVAGCSTGLASPPMAAAVSRWVRGSVVDRAQTVVNAGTGIGVLVSGPIAFTLINHWRWAWAVFAVLAAVVTFWVHRTVPSTTCEPGEQSAEGVPRAATTLLVVGAFLMGASSAAVWTFGRDVLTAAGVSSLASTAMWTVLGAAGIAGALGGDLVARAGLARSWSAGMLALSAATATLALTAGSTVAGVAAAAVFGATYIALTGVVLVWSTRIYPQRISYGVGLAFLMIAIGQAVGAPAAGLVTDLLGATTAFLGCAVLALVGALVRPRR